MISLKKSLVQTAAACILSLSAFAQGGTDSLTTASPSLEPQKTCPVMGGKIDKSVYADYDGKRVYFCCGMCVDSFKKDPVTYIKKIESMRQKVETISVKSSEKQKADTVKKDPINMHDSIHNH